MRALNTSKVALEKEVLWSSKHERKKDLYVLRKVLYDKKDKNQLSRMLIVDDELV